MNLFIFLFVLKLLNQFPIEVRPYVSAILISCIYILRMSLS